MDAKEEDAISGGFKESRTPDYTLLIPKVDANWVYHSVKTVVFYSVKQVESDSQRRSTGFGKEKKRKKQFG